MEVDAVSRKGKGKEKSGKGKKGGKKGKERPLRERFVTKQLIVGTSRRPNVKVKARTLGSPNSKWQKSVKVTAVDKSMKLGHQTRQHSSQIYLK